MFEVSSLLHDLIVFCQIPLVLPYDVVNIFALTCIGYDNYMLEVSGSGCES